MRVAKEGGSIALAPEGNRTYSGKTEYMSPSIAPLARKLGLPIVLYHITGGYGVQPRWADNVRRGRMDCFVSRVIEPEEAATMTEAELFEVIREELYVNEANAEVEFHHKKRAEYLERVIYVCPECGLSKWESHGDTAECLTCGKTVRYLPNLRLEGVNTPFPYPTMKEWYEAQNDYMNAFDLTVYNETPAYIDKVQFSEVILYKNKHILAKEATLSLYGDRYTVEMNGETLTFPFKDISTVSVLGKNKLDFYIGDKVYQVKGDKRYNAVKYMHFYFRHTHVLKGDPHDQFLGL
jgi:rubrerythrin